MSCYEARPVNPNRGVTRSGNVSGFSASHRHPTDPAFDMHWLGYVLVPLGLVLAWAVSL